MAGFQRVGGRKCTEVFNDEIFAKLREMDGVSADVVANASDFDFSKLAAGGGKGGQPLGFSQPNRRYIVKEMNGGDHAVLHDLAQDYVEHVTNGNGSLLCRFYAHFKVYNTIYVMMNNLLPPGIYTAQYDLKGCDDDKTLLRDGHRIREVHKRFYNVGMRMRKSGWSPQRKLYHENKVREREWCNPVLGSRVCACVCVWCGCKAERAMAFTICVYDMRVRVCVQCVLVYMCACACVCIVCACVLSVVCGKYAPTRS